MTLTEASERFINSLVEDCVAYRLSQEESLAYIKLKYKKISKSTLKNRKRKIEQDPHYNQWLNYFTRIGFVTHHKNQIDAIQRIQDYSMKRFITEASLPIVAPQDNPNARLRNEDRIDKLQNNIRLNAMALSELGLGTPVIAAIKAKLAEKNNLNKDKDQKDNAQLVQER